MWQRNFALIACGQWEASLVILREEKIAHSHGLSFFDLNDFYIEDTNYPVQTTSLNLPEGS